MTCPPKLSRSRSRDFIEGASRAKNNDARDLASHLKLGPPQGSTPTERMQWTITEAVRLKRRLERKCRKLERQLSEVMG